MKKENQIINTVKVVFLAFVLTVGIQYVSAQTTWAPPTTSPPGGNTFAPLNVGPSGQVKDGGLTVGHTLSNLPTGCNNAPCIGLRIENGKFKLTDGTQGLGKVLTSDANGLASWAVAAGGGSLPVGTTGQTLRHNGTNWIANSNLFNSGTTVGVGTPAPRATLHVTNTAADPNGLVRISRGTGGNSTLQLYKKGSGAAGENWSGWTFVNDPNNNLRINFDNEENRSNGDAIIFGDSGTRNVGIGTANVVDLRSKLTVGGKILINLTNPSYGNTGDAQAARRDGLEMVVGGTNNMGTFLVNKPNFEFWNSAAESRANLQANQVELSGGSPANGKVLTSTNSAGLATWETLGSVANTEILIPASGIRADCPSNKVVTGVSLSGGSVSGIYCRDIGSF